jgi:hypothetical protein
VGPGGRCIDADNSQGLKPGSRVQLWECYGGNNQRWLVNFIDGKIQLEANLKLCLDDPSGGMENHTELVVVECDNRVTQRWELVDSGFLVMGVMLGWRDGMSVTSDPYRNIEYTNHGLLSIGNTGNCAATAVKKPWGLREIGTQLQEVDCDPNDPAQQFFLSKSGQVWQGYLGVVGCLEVEDVGLPGVSNGTPIRLQKCDANLLTQKFSMVGLLSSGNNRCVAIDDHFISFNGLALRTDNCTSTSSKFFRYYPGRTIVSGLD